MKFNIVAAASCGLTSLAILCGCGGSNSISSTTPAVLVPQARIVDSMPTPTNITTKVDGVAVAGASTFGSVSNYMPLTDGNRHVVVTDSSTGTVQSDNMILMAGSHKYTAVAFQNSPSPGLLVLVDGTTVDSSHAFIRYAKVGGPTTRDDLYITVPGADISTMNPYDSGIVIGRGDQGYTSFAPGTFEFRQTDSGSKVAVIDQQITLVAGVTYTILDQGGSTFLVLQDQN